MKKISLILIFCAINFIAFGQVTVTGAVGIPDGTNFETLKAAFDALNGPSSQTGKDIIVAINACTVETATAALVDKYGWNSLKIYPTVPNLSITASTSVTQQLINFAPVSNVTFDGSVGGVGTDRSLTISQFGGSTQSTIAFQNDCKNNILRNCILKAGVATSGRAIVAFINAVTSGNDNNTISNNEFCGVSDTERPIAAIFSFSSAAGKENDHNTISNNDFHDLFMTSAFTNANFSTAIYLSNFSNDWTITGNNFYETNPIISAPADPSTSNTYYAIYITNTNANGFIITDNYIGGSAPHCGGSALSITSNTDLSNSFIAMNINVGIGTATSIQNNTIKNIEFSSSVAGGVLTLINIPATCTGNLNIGTERGNIIGSVSGSSILFTGLKAVTGANTLTGISYAGTGTINVSNNTIAGLDNATTAAVGDVIGINSNGSGSSIVERNFLTNITSSGSLSNIWGLKIGKGSNKYLNNIVSLNVNTPTSVYGIYETGPASTTNYIYFNTVNISGVVNSGTSSSYCLLNGAVTNTRDIRNNLFCNTRSGGSGKNYTIRLAGTAGLTCNFNDYYINGSAFLGYLSVDKTTFSAWTSATSQDANSIIVNPEFVNSTSSSPADLKACVSLPGTSIVSITSDFGQNNRVLPQIGAWEVLGLKSGILTPTVYPLKAYVVKNTIKVETGIGELIDVFNITGEKILTKIATSGLTDLPVESKGIFIVKSGNKLAKLIL